MLLIGKYKCVKNRISSKKLIKKGNFLIKAFFVFLCLYLISCSKDNKQADDNIVDGWGLVATGYYDVNNEVVITPFEYGISVISFLSNGKMKRLYLFEEEVSMLESSYRIEGHFLFESYTDATNAFTYKYKVEGDKLTLEYVQGNLEEIYPQIRIWVYRRLLKL